LFATLFFASCAIHIEDEPGVRQWTRFEATFESSVEYENPVQEVSVEVFFTSPSGQQRTLLAFWDGDKTWRVRFSPDETGEWHYESASSDASNTGLHQQSGAFTCGEYHWDHPFYRHGELRLSETRRFLQHADGTPFFWLADTVWCGPLLSDHGDWWEFLEDRVQKKFTAIQFVMTQWRMTPTDAEGNPAFTGVEKIAIDPAFFQRMDQYVNAINAKGLLAVPVLLWAIEGDANPGWFLPEDQKIALAKYMVARYGAHHVVWFLGGDGRYPGERAEEWKRVGQSVFSKDQHRLATMHVGGKQWAGEFRGEPWFSFIGYQSGHGDDEETFRWLNQGPPSQQWSETPPLPVINTEPNYEAHNGYTYRRAHNDHAVRRAAYWSLLVSPTAGVSYGGQGIWGWHTRVQVPADHLRSGLGSPWSVAKDLPGAFSMQYLHEFFQEIDWWRLAPAPERLGTQPGLEDASKFIAVSASEEGDLLVAYLPEGGTISLDTVGLERPAGVRWYHPRTGGWIEAGELGDPPQTFEAPDANDWVLLIARR
jgi:hypothetical protein